MSYTRSIGTETWRTDRGNSILRHSPWDGLLVGLALAHGAVLALAPYSWVIALGLWWNSNTIAHYFIHLPFFRSRRANQLFSLYQSALLGIPQTLWRQRHLAHHAEIPWQARMTRRLVAECSIIAVVWGAMCVFAPRFFFAAYLPGWVAGLGLCWLHGHYEHAHGTTSHYGRAYNWLFFNDGYHIEHHARPAAHWRSLRGSGAVTRGSRWPAAFRWMEAFTLDALERIVLRSPGLQRFVLRNHERAFRRLLPLIPPPRRVGIVGGGIFPRTALILRRLLPEAELIIVDADAENIRRARLFLGTDVQFEHALFEGSHPSGFDLVVIPLSFIGQRATLYRNPPANAVLIHDWFWRTWPLGAHVSVVLMKRLNLVASVGSMADAGESA